MKKNNRAAFRQRHLVKTSVEWIGGLMLFFLLVAGARAQSPFDGMAFQSYLVDDQGTPVTGNKTIKFSIFDAESDGTRLWAETQNVTLDTGNFSVILGQGQWDTTTGPDRVSLSDIFEGGDRYIEISVGTGQSANVLSPRLRLLPSPYTFRAKQADQLSSGKNPILTVTDTGATANLALDVKGATTLAGTTASSLNVTGATTLKNTTTTGKTTLASTEASSLKVTGQTTLAKTTAGSLTATGITSSTYLLPNGNGLTSLTGEFGNVQTRGSGGRDGWDGYSIHGRYALMSKENEVGIYNDIDNRWIWHHDRNNDHHQWLTGTTKRMVLNSNGLDVTGNIKANGTLNVTGDATLNKLLTVKGNLKANGTLNVTGNATLDKFLTVKGDKNSVTEPLTIYGGKARSNLPGWMAGQPIVPFMELNGRDNEKWMIGMSHNKTDSELTFHWSDGKTWYSSGYLEPKAGSFNITSDRRLKKNIKPYRTDILDGIEKVPVYTYNMKTESDDSPKRVGVMAQDVQAVFPELVDADESRMGLNYGHVAIMAFPAITELRQEKDAEISSLKQEVETLKSEMEGLKARLANVGTQEDRLSKLEELVAGLGSD